MGWKIKNKILSFRFERQNLAGSNLYRKLLVRYMCTITYIRYILSLFFDIENFATNLKDLLYSTNRVCYITK